MLYASTDPFSYLGFSTGSVSGNQTIRGTVASAYQLVIAFAVVGIIVTLTVAGLKIAAAPPAKRAEAFQEILIKALIAIALFCLPTIIAVIVGVINGIA